MKKANPVKFWYAILIFFFVFLFAVTPLWWNGINVEIKNTKMINETKVIIEKNNTEFIPILLYEEKEKHSSHITITDPVILLRLDDVWNTYDPTVKFIDYTIQNKIPLTIGVIPDRLKKDYKLRIYLREIRNSSSLEIAQHGYDHDESDINISDYNLKYGKSIFQSEIGISPITYIPPYNKLTKNTYNLTSKYFKIISASNNNLKEGEIAELGSTVSTYDYDKMEYTSNYKIIHDCSESLEKYNFCIVTIHPQELSTNITNATILDEERFYEYIYLINKLSELNATFVTFKDVVETKT